MAAAPAPGDPDAQRKAALPCPRERPPGAAIGVVLPKRWARRAVTRNAIRRQIYAVAQCVEAELPCAAHVVRLRAAFEPARFRSASSDALKQAVQAELRALFEQARKRQQP